MNRNKLLKTVMLLGIFCLITVNGKSQDESLQLRTFGLGLHVEQFKLLDLTHGDGIIANKIVFAINATQHLKIEPEIGILMITYTEDNDEVELGIATGLGVFGQFQKANTNIYVGGRFGYDFIKYDSYNGMETVTVKSTRISVGPIAGVEHFFSPHFSFGGELGLRYIMLRDDRSDDDSEPNVFMTESGLFVRFYF